MISACLKNPIVEGNLTILEMMAEMDKLRQENKQLLIENKRLHNSIIVNQDIEGNDNKDIGMINEYEEEYLCGCESEENLKAYDEALSNMSVRK